MKNNDLTFEDLADHGSPVTSNSLKFGPIDLVFSNGDWSPRQVIGLQFLLEQTYPHLEHYLGPPNSPGRWQLEYKRDVRRAPASCFGRERRLILQGSLRPAVVIHELVHVFHGERATNRDFFAEGLADAGSWLVAAACELPLPTVADSSFVFGTNADAGRYVAIERPTWDDLGGVIKSTRRDTVAKLWFNLETRHKGFLRSFMDRWRSLEHISLPGPVGRPISEFLHSELMTCLHEAECQHGSSLVARYASKVSEGKEQLLSDKKSQPVVFAFVDQKAQQMYIMAAVVKMATMPAAVAGEELTFMVEQLNPNVPIEVSVTALRGKREMGNMQHSMNTTPMGKIGLPLARLAENPYGSRRFNVRITAPGALAEKVFVSLQS